jgi:hypothetical protein
MPERQLVEGYANLLAELYAPESYFGRSASLVDRIGAPAHAAPLLVQDVLIALRSVLRLGVLGKRRSLFWRLLVRAVPRGVHAVRAAIACAVRGEHLIRYTEDVVLPRLDVALDQLATEPETSRLRRVSLPLLEEIATKREPEECDEIDWQFAN